MSILGEDGKPIDGAEDEDRPDISPAPEPDDTDEEPIREERKVRRVIAVAEDDQGQLLLLTQCKVVGLDCDSVTSVPEAGRLLSGAVQFLHGKMIASSVLEMIASAQAPQTPGGLVPPPPGFRPK